MMSSAPLTTSSKLISEGEVNKIDYSSMPNYQNVNQDIIDMSASFDWHMNTLCLISTAHSAYYTIKVADASDLNTRTACGTANTKDNMIMINSVRDTTPPLPHLATR